jgi:hypothetical protein
MTDSFREKDPGGAVSIPAGSSALLVRGLRAGIFLFAGLIGIPATISVIAGIPYPLVFALVGSTLVIEYAAVVPGVALQIPAYVTVTVVFSTALGVITGSLEIFDAFSLTSPRLEGFLSRIRNRTAGHFIRKYGIWGLIPAILAAGFYITPGLSFILGMPKQRSVVIMSGAFLLGEVVTLSVTAGVLKLL